MQSTKAEVVIKAQAMLGEGAIWDSAKQVLYWVNILGGEVHIYHPDTNEDEVIPVGQFVGTVVPRQKGGLLLALKNGIGSLNLETKQLTMIANPEAHLPDNRFNDGKCDPAGRFWAGTLSLEEKEPLGSLYCMVPDGKVRRMLENVTISNGLAWSLDEKTFYYIDTPTMQVAAYDYDIQTGNISNKRIVISIPEKEGAPDGMTIDAEGMLWIAHWGGWQVCRWNPFTGEKLQSIKFPVSQVTSCAFGGKELDVLYVTSARKGLNKDSLEKEPLAGALFRYTNVGARGIPAYSFAG